MKDKKNNLRYGLYCLLLVACIFLDQITKILSGKHLKNQPAKLFIKNIISFEYLENPGAAWGIFSGKTIFLLIVTVIFSMIVLYYLYRLEKKLQQNTEKQKLYITIQTIMIVLFSGAIGNIIDRIRLSYVIDFIRLDFIDFPVFNIADCYVTVSSFLLVFILLFFVKEEDF